MSPVNLPEWATDVVERAGARPGDDLSGLLAEHLASEVSTRLGTAAERLASELVMQETLLAERAKLEEEQAALLAAAGREGKAETNLGERRITDFTWSAQPVPTQESLFRAVLLLDVSNLDELPATMKLNSRRASVHFKCFELAHDNQVIGFHNAALRSQSGAPKPVPADSDVRGENG